MSGMIGFGAKLQYAAPTSTLAVPTAWTDVDDEVMITVPTGEVGTVEDTGISGADAFRTFVATLIDGGELEFEVNYNAATMTALQTIKLARALEWWRVSSPLQGVTPAAQTFAFKGILTKTPFSFETEGVARIKATVKVSGPITIA